MPNTPEKGLLLPRATNWACFAAAIGCVLTALAFSTDQWAAWFHHPARQPLPDVTRSGAALWRTMLCVAAVMLTITPLILSKLCLPRSADFTKTRLSNSVRFWLTVAVMVGLLLRMARLTESLWYDEIASYLSYGAGLDSAWPIIGNYFDPVNHVLHTLLSWCSIRWLEGLMGSEIAFRLPALLFSLGSVMVMFFLARFIWGDQTGLIAAFITAVAPVSALEGAEARGYSMMIFFSAAMLLCLLAARRSGSSALWLCYALCCALGIWAHFVTAMVPIGHAMWLGWRALRRNEWRSAACGALALALAATLTVTLYAPLLPDLLHQRGVFFSSRGDEPTILGLEGRHALMQLGGSWYWWAALPGLALALIGVCGVVLHKREIHPPRNASSGVAGAAIALSLLGLPVLIAAVLLGGSWMYARFTFFALPGGVLLMSAGLAELWLRRKAAAIVAAGIATVAWADDFVVRPSKQPLREAAAYVRSHRKTEDRLLVIGVAHEVMRVYGDDLNMTYSMFHGRDLERRLEKSQPRWIVVEYSRHLSAETNSILQSRGYVVEKTLPGWADWGAGEIVIMDCAGPSPERALSAV